MAISAGTWVAYSGADASTLTVTSSSFTSSSGQLLIASVTWEDTSNTTLTFSDSKGNTWQTAVVSNGAGAKCGICWCVPTSVGASHTVTCTYPNSSPFRRIGVLPVNGTWASADALSATSQTNSGGTTAIDAGSLTTSKRSISFMGGADYGASSFTAGTGWTKLGTATGRHAQYRIDDAGTYDPAGTLSGVNDWSAAAFALGETAGGGGATLIHRGLMLGVGI